MCRSKNEYMLYKFSQHKKNEVEVSLDGVVVPKCKQYRYIGLLFEENGIVDEDVPPRIKYAWLKWRVLPGCCVIKGCLLK